MSYRKSFLTLSTAFFVVALSFPAVASAEEPDTVATQDECVLIEEAPAGFAELETAVASLSVANDERIAAEVNFAESVATSELVSELEADAAKEVQANLAELGTLTNELVTVLEESVTTAQEGERVDIDNLTTLDTVALTVAELQPVLEAEKTLTANTQSETLGLAAVAVKLETFDTMLSTVRPLLIANMDTAAVAVYSKPTTVSIRELVDVRAIEADKAISAGQDLVADSAAIRENLTELASAESALTGKIEADVLNALGTSLANTDQEVATLMSALNSRATTAAVAESSTADLVGSVNVLSLDLAANLSAIESVSSELAVSIGGQDEATKATRETANAVLAEIDSSLAAQLVRLDAALAVATRTTALGELATMNPEVASAASAFTLPHAANALILEAAAADLGALNAAAEAEDLNALAASVTPRSALNTQLTTLAATMRPLAAIETSGAEALGADGAVIAAAGRFLTATSTALTDGQAALSEASTALQASRGELLALKLEAGSSDAIARDSAIAIIDRSATALNTASASLETSATVRAKYSLATSKEAAVVKEPVVAEKEAIVTVKEPVVAVKEPVVAVKEPVVAEKEAIVTVKEPVVAVRGVSTTQAQYEVVEGNSVRVEIAALADGESSVTVSLDEIATHGGLDLVQSGDTCELVFTSEAGCLGVQTVELEVDVDGITTTKVIEFTVSASDVAATTLQTTQAPAVLAFTGPSSAHMLTIAGATLILLGTIARAGASPLRSRTDR